MTGIKEFFRPKASKTPDSKDFTADTNPKFHRYLEIGLTKEQHHELQCLYPNSPTSQAVQELENAFPEVQERIITKNEDHTYTLTRLSSGEILLHHLHRHKQFVAYSTIARYYVSPKLSLANYEYNKRSLELSEILEKRAGFSIESPLLDAARAFRELTGQYASTRVSELNTLIRESIPDVQDVEFSHDDIEFLRKAYGINPPFSINNIASLFEVSEEDAQALLKYELPIKPIEEDIMSSKVLTLAFIKILQKYDYFTDKQSLDSAKRIQSKVKQALHNVSNMPHFTAANTLHHEVQTIIERQEAKLEGICSQIPSMNTRLIETIRTLNLNNLPQPFLQSRPNVRVS